MKVSNFLLGIFLTASLSSVLAAQSATRVFMNGNIYTANDKQRHAQAVAVNHDRIIFVGSNASAKQYENSKTRIIDLHGATMLPGLADAHMHFIGVGEREMSFNLEGVKSIDELLAKLKARVAQAKPGEWIVGSGWIETFWNPPVFPTRWQLDRVAPDNPVYLSRSDWHSSVVNSAALKIAGITKDTKNPFGGEILHDKKTGEPVGMLVDAAEHLLDKYIPVSSDVDTERAMLLADQWSIAHGLTQVQEPKGTYHEVSLYQKLYRENKLKIRIYKGISGPGKEADQLLHDGPIIESFNNHFNVRVIKVVSDGALGSRGAALLAPYHDEPQSSGFVSVETKTYQAMLQSALQQGIQVQTHAIGDAANRFTLDEYAKALHAVPPAQRKITDPRWRIEHAQIVSPADIPRFKALNIIPSMQPSHAISDLHYAENRLGRQRLSGAYAWHSFIQSGVMVPGGSDAPVERGDPMIEFYAAIARKDLQGYSGKGWHPEEAVTRDQALKMFTLWPAYAAFEEHLRGSIEVGKLADFTVLSADIMTIPASHIIKTKCLMTVIGGELVYTR